MEKRREGSSECFGGKERGKKEEVEGKSKSYEGGRGGKN